MTPLWRGFAGLVAVFFLAYYVTNLEKKTEEEKALISSDPQDSARIAFEEKEFSFYQVWVHRYDEDGKQIGYWVLPGSREISELLLDRYPDRIKLENTEKIQISLEHDRESRKARRWAYLFNVHLSDLLDP